MTSADIEGQLSELEAFEDTIKSVAKKLMAPGEVEVFPLDLLATAVMDRSLSIIFGFTSMVRSNNFTCAAPLVRLHLDSLLRFYAGWICPDPHELTNAVLKGAYIGKLQDRKGKKMTDTYLMQQLAKEHPWVANVYDHTSGWVHLSNKHIFNSTTIANGNERIMSHKISRMDNFSDASKIEAIECMKEITHVLLEYLEGWNYTKRAAPNNSTTQ